MLTSGKEKLERMRDGRAIYIGAERVDDVTRHPAFKNAAQTIAGLYDLKADPQQRELFSFEESGERYGLHWLRCRSREDLARRMRAMKAIADATYGLIGRSPDHVAGLITGLAMNPALLDQLTPGFGENLTRYYEFARRNDLYISFAVTPPSGIRSREIFTGDARDASRTSATPAKVPWDRVFFHNNGAMSRRIYIETPANCYQNQQSNVRFWAKMGLIVGLASRMCQANGVDKIPAVRETLGRLAALEATIGGLVNGQIEACEQWPDGYATPNRRIMYATLNWCQEHHTEIIDALRTLAGAAPLQMPASIDLVADRELKERFERWWSTPALHAVDRLKLYKLAWDLIGSEFAGRHMLYERFYAGNSIIVRNQSDREAPWEKFHAIVDGLLQRIEAPG